MEIYHSGPHTRYDLRSLRVDDQISQEELAGYFVASSGNVTEEAIMAYIREQQGVEPSDGGDDFQLAIDEPTAFRASRSVAAC